MTYDCVIIGGGPAGLNSALMLGRARRSIALIDNHQPRNAVTNESHGFITRDGISPAQFRSIAYAELSNYPSIDMFSTEIMTVEKLDTGFKLAKANGHPIQARKLILATGLREIFPKIDGLYPLYGKSLFNCPYCDGWELRDQPLIVVSEQPAVYQHAKLLLNWSKDLVVSTNGKKLLSDEQIAQLHSKGIVVIEEAITKFVGQNGQLEQVIFADECQIQRTGGFVYPTFLQSVPFGESLGAELTESGGLKTDEWGRTSVPGLYAAGDAAYIQPSQVIFAAAHGSRTAMCVNLDLTEEDV